MAIQDEAGSLRERKRRRTRSALIDAAAELFARKGYDETTVAEIAAAAEIGTRTFFSYFASKEEILFPDSADRVRATLEAIEARGPGEGPVEVLLRAVREISEADADMVSPMAAVRTRLMRTVPAVQGRALLIQQAAQRDIARQLRDAFPGELDAVRAGALVGAMTGAVGGALQALLEDPETAGELAADPQRLRGRLRSATRAALEPWSGRPG
ncbi:TetR/AcrR family transcriptional regulator [Streptomyces sp. NBC_01304]|uniref:TetR/AcrR family transcriptional regulator n=1 Tax=Streptomyces sp. NBC_01304 TaxID=2903818 RepID=UPI002E0EDAAD|nr:TetR/AcrR family transcriptional regulator [Streptomyces sp. NBC_01304]